MRERTYVEPYRVVVADPPWRLDDQLPGDGRGAGKHYELLTIGKIERFPLPPIADNAVLFLWRLASMPEEALWVMRAWGFVPKSEVTWVKTKWNAEGALPHPMVETNLHFGMGRYVRNAHETCLIGARGKAAAMRLDAGVRSVLFAPVGVHSEKPERFYELVERMFPGPYVELFARRTRPGWTCLGREVDVDPASLRT